MVQGNSQWVNKLYFGDNLDILRDKIPDNFVDLIYLDPPFQSGKDYNQIFQPGNGEYKGATAQIQAFEDTWKWGPEAQKAYEGLINGTIIKEKPNQKLIDLMKSMRSYLDQTSMMAYLAMMAPRLLELKRVLKNTGSIYLHCDPTASHYLKLLMDSIFGVGNFRNEIIWSYQGTGEPKKAFKRKHDIIFFYTKTDDYFFDTKGAVEKISDFSKSKYTQKDEDGYYKEIRHKDGKIYKQYQKEFMRLRDVWDIPIINAMAKERLNYPTQKPEALLERIIKASSSKGDIVLDPFCGCGTTVAVAEKLERRWIGIDITYVAIDIISKRLSANKKKTHIANFEIDGEPKDVYSAKKLVADDPFQFQIWAISKLGIATPSETKSADRGVDGIINFVDKSKKSEVGKAIIQVKGTENIDPSMVRDLKGTLKSQDADFAILITFKKPTQGMINEATEEGYFEFMGRKIPRIQFLTIEDLFKVPISLQLPYSFIIDPFNKPIIEKELKEIQKDLFNE